MLLWLQTFCNEKHYMLLDVILLLITYLLGYTAKHLLGAPDTQ
jgi:hypothetical protein